MQDSSSPFRPGSRDTIGEKTGADNATGPSASTGSLPEGTIERRRMRRVQISMPVTVSGQSDNQNFKETAYTVAVNAYGGSVYMAAKVKRMQEIRVRNPRTDEELLCRVVLVGKKEGSCALVGFEFLEPAPRFWRIAFPPEDWNPAERKRPQTLQR